MRKLQYSGVPPTTSQDDPPTFRTSQRRRHGLDVEGLSQVHSSVLPRPDPSHHHHPRSSCDTIPSRSAPSPEPTSSRGGQQTTEVEEPNILPNLKFLREIFFSTRGDPSLRS